MLMFDIESLGTESSSIVLSAAITYFDPEKPMDFEHYLSITQFVKFDALEQKQAGRTSDEDTMNWWKAREEAAKVASLYPSKRDVSMTEGIRKLRDYVKQSPGGMNQIIWARGCLDQVCIESLCRTAGVDPIVKYYNWRDVRTFIDLTYGASSGYVDVEGLDPNKVIKHDPRHDCVYDVMQILCGKSNG